MWRCSSASQALVALGLAESPEADATALLVEAYAFETEPSVRAAVVRALSRRRDKLRDQCLATAETLDPNPAVRAMARSARAGRQHTIAMTPGREFAWITLRPNDSEAGSDRRRAALLLRGDGLAFPTVSDPDGVLLVGGIETSDDLQLRLQPGE